MSDSNMNTTTVVIIGAGVAGLTLGTFLLHRGSNASFWRNTAATTSSNGSGQNAKNRRTSCSRASRPKGECGEPSLMPRHGKIVITRRPRV